MNCRVCGSRLDPVFTSYGVHRVCWLEEAQAAGELGEIGCFTCMDTGQLTGVDRDTRWQMPCPICSEDRSVLASGEGSAA